MIIINDEQLAYLIKLYQANELTWDAMTDEFNIKYPEIDWKVGRLRHFIRKGIRKGEIESRDGVRRITGDIKQTAAVTINNDGTQVSDIKIRMSAEQAKDPDYVLKAHGYEPTMWTIKKATSNIWGQKVGEEPLYQSKIVVEPKTPEKIDYVKLLTSEIEPVTITKINSGKRNLIIPIADWHFGITKLSDVMPKLSEVVEIISKGYDQIVILQLGDLFHSSQMKKSVTMNETQLNDVDMEQAVLDCRKFFDLLLTECIKNSNRVSLEHAEGNHSGNLEYMFLVYLEAKYPNVKVNYHNKYRTAFSLNRVGFFITHGQYAKRKDLPMLFATEYPEVWAQSTTREILTGHFHTMQTQDYNGVVHRQLGTIKQNDDYEIQNGWTMNKKVVQLFEYNDDQLKVTYDV